MGVFPSTHVSLRNPGWYLANAASAESSGICATSGEIVRAFRNFHNAIFTGFLSLFPLSRRGSPEVISVRLWLEEVLLYYFCISQESRRAPSVICAWIDTRPLGFANNKYRLEPKNPRNGFRCILASPKRKHGEKAGKIGVTEAPKIP